MTWVILAIILLPSVIVGMLLVLHVLDEQRLRRELQDQSISGMLKKAAHYPMSDSERELQRRSFAYGNANLANPHVTRPMVDDAANKIEDSDNDTPPAA